MPHAMSITRRGAVRSDEWATPREEVEKIVPFVLRHMNKFEPNARILCPFDSRDSEFVRVFTGLGFAVDYGDIINDKRDFFTDWDFSKYALIISNPPYSKWFAVMRTLLASGVPFAMFARLDGLINARINYEAVFNNRETMGLLIGRKPSFLKDGRPARIPYHVAWVTNKFIAGGECLFID